MFEVDGGLGNTQRYKKTKMKNFAIFALVALTGLVSSDDTRQEVCDPGVSYDDCLKELLENKGGCTAVTTPKDSVELEDRSPIFLPSSNMTCVTKNLTPSFKGTTTDVYMVGNKVVTTTDYSQLCCNDTELIYAFPQLGQEYVTVRDYVQFCFPEGTLVTSIFTLYDGRFTEKTFKTALITSSRPNADVYADIGPSVSQSSDELISTAFTAFATNIETSVADIDPSKVPYLHLAWMQNNIADCNIAPSIRINYDPTVIDRIVAAGELDPSLYERPCGSAGDISEECVQMQFKQDLDCKSPSGQTVVHRDFYISPVPPFDSIFYIYDATFGGLDGKIVDYYYNPQTENVVYTVEFSNGIEMNTKKSVEVIPQVNALPKEITDWNKDKYYFTMTTMIPTYNKRITDKGLREMQATAYFQSPLAGEYEAGPKQTESSDPEVEAIDNKMNENPTLLTAEIVGFDTNFMSAAHRKLYICDYDV